MHCETGDTSCDSFTFGIHFLNSFRLPNKDAVFCLHTVADTPAHAAAMGAMIPVFFGFDWRGGLGLPVSIFEKGEDGFPRSEEWCCVLPLVAAGDGTGGYGQ